MHRDIYSAVRFPQKRLSLKEMREMYRSKTAHHRKDQLQDKRKRTRNLLISVYAGIWAASVILFWGFTGDSDAMAYGFLVFWIVLPVSTFVISLLLSRNAGGNKLKWAGAVGFGIMYMLADYMTFMLANNLAADRINLPNADGFAAGTVLSITGMGIGHMIYRMKKRQ